MNNVHCWRPLPRSGNVVQHQLVISYDYVKLQSPDCKEWLAMYRRKFLIMKLFGFFWRNAWSVRSITIDFKYIQISVTVIGNVIDDNPSAAAQVNHLHTKSSHMTPVCLIGKLKDKINTILFFIEEPKAQWKCKIWIG